MRRRTDLIIAPAMLEMTYGEISMVAIISVLVVVGTWLTNKA